MTSRTARAHAVLLVTAVLVTPLRADARFAAATAVGANTFATATLEPGGPIAGTWSCPGRTAGYDLQLTWPPSPSTFARGYIVESAPAPDGPWTFVASVPEPWATDSGIAKKTTVHYRVVAEAYLWRSPASTASFTAPNPQC